MQAQRDGCDQARHRLARRRSWWWTVALRVLRQVLGLVGLGSSPDAKDVEIAVLRHQLVVLSRNDCSIQ
jgi:hypothetical protein